MNRLPAAVCVLAGALLAGGHAAGEEPEGPIVPRFTDVTAESGVDFSSVVRPERIGYGQGAAAADIDGDGDLDFFLPQDRGPCALYRNEGNLQFTGIGAAAGVQVSAKEAHAKAAAFVDYDRDGDPDLFVGTAGEGNWLFRNRGDGTFEDVTGKAGIGGGKGCTPSLVPGDFDGDGWPDVYEVVGPALDYFVKGPENAAPAPDRLWRNNRDGTFTDVAGELGVADPLAGWTAAWFDADGDGQQDLLVANDCYFYEKQPTRDRVYRNLGPGAGFRFEDEAAAFGMDEAHSGMGFTIADLDGDGAFDVYTPDWGPNEVRLGSDPLPRPDRAFELGIADDESGIMNKAITWGCVVEDLDRDGWNDLLVFRGALAAGDPGKLVAARQVPCLWLSRPARQSSPGSPGNGRVFLESAKEAGLRDLLCHGARAALPADLDGDGDLDILLSTRFGKARVLRNDTPVRGPWYGVRLRGTRSTREGWGAVLELRAGERTHRKLCYAGGQTGATLPPEWIFVPGPDAGEEVRLTVRWPTGKSQEATPVRNGWTTVVEGE